MINIGIIGGTGYTGLELLRLLAGHQQAAVRVITSRGEAGTAVSDLFPSLRGVCDLRYVDPVDVDYSDCDVVFLAAPTGVAMNHVPALLESGIKVIDLSADFRLNNVDQWNEWYGQIHKCPELLVEAVYGLPERHRDAIRGARLVANPGCYPTAVQLGFIPLLEAGVVDHKMLIADAKSGVSGAGRTAAVPTLLTEAADSLKAYAVPGHRHLPEIRQELETVADEGLGLTFVPHLAPMIRGIHATLYARLKEPTGDLTTLFSTRYAGEPFVDVMPAGSHPDTRSVRGSNTVRIACHRPQDSDVAVILVVVDNLVKGAAGQAIQNMNLMCDLDEKAGLAAPGLVP
uniref:N-acetyl-gamma-glutamyl-phosphate reductase n=1 Tax=uncultured gamma proteobacterium HF4000_06A21 TaxID=723581 RepID=E7C858_9GAMM|nr:acetylglutamate semialdehyde dehydrogenase [uncultured gamma proteobacterium HF4000_06A21]